MEQTLTATQSSMNHTAEPSGPSDEINLLEYIYVLVKNKKRIIVLTLFGLVLGFIAALIKGPTWVAETLIAPKEVESQKTPSLAGLGMLGGFMANQLNLSGNASLDKMDLILDSRDFGAKLIEKHSLLPLIFQYQWPEKYKKYWDPVRKTWKPIFKIPQPLGVGEFLKEKFLKKTKDVRSNTILLEIQSRDSAFTINLATMYVEYLNEYIKTTVQNEAKENVTYLDTQLVGIADPLLREKILGLIANEIEKEMVVSKEAFRVIDPVYLYPRYKEKFMLPFVIGLGMFLIACFITVFAHFFSSSGDQKADALLIEKIKQEILPVFVRKK